MSRAKAIPPLLPILSWGLLGWALALVFLSWDPYTMRAWYNADNLQMIGLFYDLAVHHYPLTQQSLSQAMYWFPDVLVQAILASVSGFNPHITLIGGGWLTSMATIGVGHRCLQRIIPTTTALEKRRQLSVALNGLLILAFSGMMLLLPYHQWADVHLKALWFPHMLLWPCFHNGVIFMTLLALWLTLIRRAPDFTDKPQSYQRLIIVGYLGLMLIGTLSDRLLLFTWGLPLTGIALLHWRDKPLRLWTLFSGLAALVAWGLIALWQRVGHFTSISITWDWPETALRHWLVVAQDAPLSIWLGLLLSVVVAMGLMITPRFRLFGVVWLTSISITLMVVILTQMMQDYQAFRYVLPFMGLSLWAVAWASAWGITQYLNTFHRQRWAFALSMLAVIGVVNLSLVFVASGRLMRVWHFTPPFTPCLDALGPGFDHSTGIAEYWVDRPNELFTSIRDLTLLTVYPDGKPRHWLNNAQEWHDPQQPNQSPPIRFAIMKGLDPIAMHATWGLPDRVVTCRRWPEVQIWVFSPARRYANQLQ